MPPYRFGFVDRDKNGNIGRSWVDEGSDLTGRMRAIPSWPPLAYVEVVFISPDGAAQFSPVYENLDEAELTVKQSTTATALLDEAIYGKTGK